LPTGMPKDFLTVCSSIAWNPKKNFFRWVSGAAAPT
jgi:hypothetical protein